MRVRSAGKEKEKRERARARRGRGEKEREKRERRGRIERYTACKSAKVRARERDGNMTCWPTGKALSPALSHDKYRAMMSSTGAHVSACRIPNSEIEHEGERRIMSRCLCAERKEWRWQKWKVRNRDAQKHSFLRKLLCAIYKS